MEAILTKLAKSNNTILITGRTGTGKSHLAKEIHLSSNRKEKKFIAINLATLSENIIESELFGHERGAFSGADQKRIGKLEAGNEGELSLRLQTKLLEALNSKTISPVGSNREIQLNIRIIAATNKCLEQMVKAKEFREDLYFRLNTFQIELPNLNEQKHRIANFIREIASKSAREQANRYETFTQEYLNAFQLYPWPGNIRELKNAIEFGLAVTDNGILDERCLPAYVKKHLQQGEVSPLQRSAFSELPSSYYESKAQFEKIYLEEMLKRFEGKINLTARSTSLSKVTLIEKIKKYGIDVQRIKYSQYAETANSSTRH